MPDWVLTLIGALLTGGGIGGVITALVTARNSAFANLNSLIQTLQEERKADRERYAALEAKVDNVHLQLQLHREWSATLWNWGLDGAPPPPPRRPDGLL